MRKVDAKNALDSEIKLGIHASAQVYTRKVKSG